MAKEKEKLLVLSNFFFCHYVFKKPSAAEASIKGLKADNSLSIISNSQLLDGMHMYVKIL